MKLTLRIFCFALVFLIAGCANQAEQPAETPKNDGPKPTGPTEETPVSDLVSKDEPEAISSKTLAGEWIVSDYDFESYVHVKGMTEKQKKNFEQLVANLIGKMRFVF